jgi:hypothetical protein
MKPKAQKVILAPGHNAIKPDLFSGKSLVIRQSPKSQKLVEIIYPAILKFGFFLLRFVVTGSQLDKIIFCRKRRQYA